jgi:hypothetical protein
MRHDWILDVLADLQTYAAANDLPELALKVAEALDLARREIAAIEAEAAGLDPDTFRVRRRVH